MFAAVLGAGPLWSSPAHAEEGSLAVYKGRIIDLSTDWEGAQACAILASGNSCFDSQAELEAELGGGTSKSASESASINGADTIDSYCNGISTRWLVLYENTSFGGRSLSFRDQGFWQNLSTYSFDNAMSSWDNNTYCDAYASWDSGGGGSWLTMSALSSNSNVGATWDNQASAIYIT